MKLGYIYKSMKGALHHGQSPCKFVNFSEFFKNLWVGSRYGASKLCAFIVIFTVIFLFYIFWDFEKVENLLKLSLNKLCGELRNEEPNLEISWKTNSLCQFSVTSGTLKVITLAPVLHMKKCIDFKQIWACDSPNVQSVCHQQKTCCQSEGG